MILKLLKMNSDTAIIPPMMAQAKGEKKKSEFLQSILSMDWKGVIAVIVFTAPIFWTMVFSKTDDRYLQLKVYNDAEMRKDLGYQRDQVEIRSTLQDIRAEQKEQKALIIQSIRDSHPHR